MQQTGATKRLHSLTHSTDPLSAENCRPRWLLSKVEQVSWTRHFLRSGTKRDVKKAHKKQINCAPTAAFSLRLQSSVSPQSSVFGLRSLSRLSRLSSLCSVCSLQPFPFSLDRQTPSDRADSVSSNDATPREFVSRRHQRTEPYWICARSLVSVFPFSSFLLGGPARYADLTMEKGEGRERSKSPRSRHSLPSLARSTGCLSLVARPCAQFRLAKNVAV